MMTHNIQVHPINKKELPYSISNVKFIRGQSAAIVHTDCKSLSTELLNFKDGGFLKKYFSFITGKSGRVKKLPIPTVISYDDDSSVIVESFRRSSKSNEVLRLIQQFVKIDINQIAFFSILGSQVTTESSNSEVNNQYFIDNNLTVVNDQYSERGNIQLSFLPHSRTTMKINVEVAYDEKSMKILAIQKYLQGAIDISKVANEYFDRSEEVDEAVNNDFVSNVIPSAKGLTVGEQALIDKSMEYVDKPFVRIPKSLKKDSSIEMFHVLSSTDAAWGKAVGIIDTSRLKDWVGFMT